MRFSPRKERHVDKRDAEQQLIDAGSFLLREIMDVKTTGETLRWLLVERGVITDREFVAAYELAAEKLWQALERQMTRTDDILARRILQHTSKGSVQ
jgi:hypothetical protein